MATKTNVHDLLRAKGSRKWVQLHVDSAAEAAAAEASGIVVLSCEADHLLPAIRTAAPNSLISAGMPHGTSATPDEAVRAAFAALRMERMRSIVRIPLASSKRWRARGFP